jgi:L-ectoine synthase
MIVRTLDELHSTEREVHCPRGGFVSTRLLLAGDRMGFSVHHTFIPEGEWHEWHYRHHLEACYCVQGMGLLHDIDTNRFYQITPGTLYALDENDRHSFKAQVDTVLISVFNPPCVADEVHGEDGAYPAVEASNE